jgi:hypothetical protein
VSSLSGARASSALAGSSTVPSLSAAASVGRSSGGDGDCDGGWGWGASWYGCYSPGFYGYWGYPYGFSFGVSFGYPYYPYYCYPRFGYWPRYYVGYPYYGYYAWYPYRYLDYYPYYGCDYYDGYYVRFGPYRSSYYVTCSGYGYHSDAHHCHHHACDSHGDHAYHVRDCLECYPSGGSYVYRDVEVPDDVTAPAVVEAEALPVPPAAGATGDVAPPPPAGEGSFYATLRPAQLSFVLGLHAMEGREYDQATESFFNASIEDPDSRLVKLFLAASLFSVGEYRYAAEYIRLGLESWEEFPRYDWDVRGLYGSAGDFETHLALLEKHVTLEPGDVDAQIVLGFVSMHSGSIEKAGAAFDAVRALASDPVELAIASRYLTELEDRSGAFPRSDEERFDLAVREDPAVRAFLASHALKDVPALPIR